MTPAVADFLFEAANLLLLAGTLGWLLFRPVRAALDAERRRHADEAGEAGRLREEADTLLRQARDAREAAERDVAHQREAAVAAARDQAKRIRDEAGEIRETSRARLEQELASLREVETAALAEAAGAVAARSVVGLLESLDGPSLDLALVRGACSRLEAMPARERDGALVESARALDADAGVLLSRALDRGYETRVVPELGAGVRVTVTGGQVDATASSIARAAARSVSEAAATDGSDRGRGDG